MPFVCCTRKKIRFSSKKNKKQVIEYVKIKHVFLLTTKFSVIDLNGIANLLRLNGKKTGVGWRVENVALAIYMHFLHYFSVEFLLCCFFLVTFFVYTSTIYRLTVYSMHMYNV